MFLLLLLVWIMFNGRFTLEILLFGLVLSLAICFFCSKATGYRFGWERRLFRMLPFYVRYAFNLVIEVVKANIGVARIVLSRKAEVAPMLAVFRPSFRRDHSEVLLANSITITPGTITARLEHGELTVHCLTPDMAKDIDQSSFVRLINRMEAK